MSTCSSPRTLAVSVAWQEIQPKVWREISHELCQVSENAAKSTEATAKERPSDPELEVALNWPPGTFAVLRRAFRAKLSRDVGWEGAAASVRVAAAVFKRGVAYRGPGQEFTPRSFSHTYPIRIHTGSPVELCKKSLGWRVIDARVAHAWPSLQVTSSDLVLDLDEHRKVLPAVAAIIRAARAHGTLSTTWQIIGGGLIADTAAFAAALVGVPIVLIPTTLLAMADACVGGKTGVNFPPFGKNQLGRFYFPQAVEMNTAWLQTLPKREVLAGGAECLKHAFLQGDLALAQKLVQALATQDLVTLTDLLPDIAEFKAQVVASDPNESGARAILNFGHTLAHALEGLSQSRTKGAQTLLHGEAVALGMLYAVLLSQQVAGLDHVEAQTMIDMLRRSMICPSLAQLAVHLDLAMSEAKGWIDLLLPWIQQDKKMNQDNLGRSAQSQWVLLSAPGKVRQESPTKWTQGVEESTLRVVWSDFSSALLSTSR